VLKHEKMMTDSAKLPLDIVVKVNFYSEEAYTSSHSSLDCDAGLENGGKMIKINKQQCDVLLSRTQPFRE
ncbi:hypothetical protein BgiMline_033930, partial [Biomphalaria glabrata]